MTALSIGSAEPARLVVDTGQSSFLSRKAKLHGGIGISNVSRQQVLLASGSRDVSHLRMIRHRIEEAADIVGWSESEAARLRPAVIGWVS